MNSSDFVQIGSYLLALLILAPVLGIFMAKIFDGEKTILSPLFGKLEILIYRAAGVDPRQEMDWKTYSLALLAFNILGFAALLLLQLIQAWLPLNPQRLPNLEFWLAFNTAVSFVTNTNWQSYAGEVTMSHLTQMLGLGVQNFVSAGTGIAAFLALARGLHRHQVQVLGNFWVDLTRSVLYVLLPLSVILGILLMGQGVIQNFSPDQQIVTLEGDAQILPGGPAASQIAIKQLGTNGGGFFNANSAHPFENPTPFSNWLEMLAILLVPAALTLTYGRMIRAPRQGWLLFIVMTLIWLATLMGSLWAEHQPILGQLAALEGKEQRFGITNSVIWSTATTAASNGSVNSMHSSLSPMAGGLAMFNMMMGEVIFGGAGSGLYGMLLLVLLTVFLSGLMVGRSPEYLGKKIEAVEIKWAILGILGPCAVILSGAALSSILPVALSSLSSSGPHGFSEILYAWTSAAANNGSAFAGLNANTPYWNIGLGIAILIGRFIVIFPVLRIAGSLATKKITPPSAGTFHTDTPIFALLLIGVIVIVGALTFFPALALGPLMEHFL